MLARRFRAAPWMVAAHNDEDRTDVMPDFRLALRNLLKTPFVTGVAILSLALGVGANGAIFSLFDQMLMRALPVAEPHRLVNLVAPGPKPGSQSCNDAGDCDSVFSYLMYRDLEGQSEVFAGVAAHRAFGANLAFAGTTAVGSGMMVSGGYFPTLGLRPALGRLLEPGDDAAIGETRVVVLGHDYWRRQFGARTDLLGETLVVNGEPLAIVGVAPAGFRGTTLGTTPDVYVPITLLDLLAPNFMNFDSRRSYWVYLFARLAPGVSRERAETVVNVAYHTILNEVEAPLQKGMSEQTLALFRAKRVELEPGWRGQSSLHELAKTPLFLLFAVAGVVLLIACANIANLLLARAASRAGEIAVRLSIGASRRRLIVQLLTEACLLALFGAVAGLLVAHWTLALIGRLLPVELTTGLELGLDWPVIAFAAALAVATGLLFGIYPALHSTRLDLASALKGDLGQPGGTRAASRFRASLVTAQVALSTLLLVAAGLFAKSLINVSRVDLGVEIDNLITFSVSPELNGYPPERSGALFRRIEQELAALPGVKEVVGARVPLLGGSSWGTNVEVEGYVADVDADTNSRYNQVGPGFFRVVGIPLLAGRVIEERDVAGAPLVAVVNQAFARKFELGSEVVGRRMSTGFDDAEIEIVGLVADAKYNEVKDAVPPIFFRPYRQDPRIGTLYFYLRTVRPPDELLATIPRTVARLDPTLPVDNLKTMRRQVRENVYVDRFITTLSATFAALATLLAAIGLYGVLAYTVTQRTRELGLRMALGADGGRIRRLVLGQMGRLTVIGAGAGIAAALALGKVARSQLYQLEGHDPAVFAASILVLAGVALAAGFIPARRAARIDPMIALRHE